MSSSAFEVTLRPDKSLRRAVNCSAVAALLAGLYLILALQLPMALRACLACLWTADVAWALCRRRRGERRLERLTLDAAGNIGVAAGGRRRAVRLASGSLVTAHCAWLRLRFDDGLCHGELVLPCGANRAAWHGLQLIWRQSGNAFGQSGRA